MITVSDMDRSVQFYRDVLGLPLRFQLPYWTEFATEGTTLALHGGGQPRAAGAEGGSTAGTVGIGWEVEDVDAVCAGLEASGVRFVREPITRENEGIRLAVFLDPDGAELTVAQVLRR